VIIAKQRRTFSVARRDTLTFIEALLRFVPHIQQLDMESLATQGWWKFLLVLTSQKMRILLPKGEEHFLGK